MVLAGAGVDTIALGTTITMVVTPIMVAATITLTTQDLTMYTMQRDQDLRITAAVTQDLLTMATA